MGDGDFVWSGDDSDRGEGSEADGADGESPFRELLDRIDGGGSADVDELADLLPSAGSGESGDIEKLLDRTGRRRGRTGTPAEVGDRTESASASAGADGGAPGSSPREPPSVDDLPELDGDERTGEAASTAGESPSDSGRRFDDLLDRLGREAGPGDPSGTRIAPPDAGSLPPDASGILLLGTSDDDDDFETCLSILRETTDPRRTNLLLVWLGRDVDGRLERLYDDYADRGTDVTVVCRSKVERSLRAESAIPADGLEGNLTIERISDPRDLPKLGIAISQAIGGSADGSTETVMCFHSITDLLQFASEERVFRFLHVLQGRIDSIDASGYYHIDREAHEERTVATFWNLFDATVDLTGG